MPRSTPGNYVPLDVNYARDAGVRLAGPNAELLFIRGLAYAKSARTCGFIPSYDLPVVGIGLKGVPTAVRALVRERLWLEVEGGWRIRSWGKWNGTDDAFHDERSGSGTKGNHVRWHVKEGKSDPECEWCSESSPESLPESLSESLSDPTANRKGREGKEREERTPSSAAADDAFDDFWKLYPKKVGKQDARRVWDRKTRTTDPTDIIAGLRRYLPIYGQADPQFIPHPSTWLQQGRWEDEVPDGNPAAPDYWKVAP